MAIQNNLPAYAGLFGNLDFKKGDESRTVYSPAAYLVDLLQLLDDEFDASTIDFDTRRTDVKNIDLDEENTNTIIPYLDIVNEVLEGRVDSVDAYDTLKSAEYPFNMPFSLENEKIKNHLKHLDISAHELRRLFATSDDYSTVAREYLGLSEQEAAAFIEPSGTLTEANLKAAYGYSGDVSFTSAMSELSTLLESTELAATDARTLIYQDLYVDPSDHSIVEDGRENFYINRGLSSVATNDYYSGYVTLNTDETKLEWVSLSHVNAGASEGLEDLFPASTVVPLAWFDRVSRFVRFAQKTGLSFTELDLILRQCAQQDGVPTINSNTLIYVAQVVYLHKTLGQPIDAVVAMLSSVSVMGQGNDDLPKDQFNRIFNLPCVKVDNKYIAVSEQPSVAPQYQDTTYNDYSEVVYYADLFSDENDDYRKRLRHTLGFTTTDLINITERFEYEGIADSSLWENTENEWTLLNYLYQIHALSTALDVHFLELFTLFDLLEFDPYIGRFDPQNYFVYSAPSTQKCFQILLNDDISDGINDKLWLLESLTVLNRWMKEYGYSTDLLWGIVNGAPTTDAQEQAQDDQALAMYNALLKGFSAHKLSPESFSDLDDERAAKFAYKLVKHSCGKKNAKTYKQMSGMGEDWLYHKNMRKLVRSKNFDMDKLTQDFVSQLEYVGHKEFTSLALGEKLQQKIIRNLVMHQMIDGEGVFIDQNIIEAGIADKENFSLAEDFSSFNERVYQLFHGIYLKANQAAENTESEDGTGAAQVQIFKSDLQQLGLTASQAKELYDNLIFNGYIDEEGKVPDPEMFADSDAIELKLSVFTEDMQRRIMGHFNQQLDKFAASTVRIDVSLFTALDIDQQSANDLIINLKQNEYLDDDGTILDPLRIAAQTPDTMQIPAMFYPQRKAIYEVFEQALADNREQYLAINKDELRMYCDKVASLWVYQQLKGKYLDDNYLIHEGFIFFSDEENQANFELSAYFDEAQRNLVFSHMADIISYANGYKLTDETLTALDFTDGEVVGIKSVLVDMGVLDNSSMLQAHQLEFFKHAANAENFTVVGFEDYDRETFFALHEIAKHLDNTVASIEGAIQEVGEAQQQAVLAQLAGVFGIDSDAIGLLSKAIFKTQNDLHVAWLAPLFRSANVLARIEELPVDMIYSQNVKRIGQFAHLVKKLQLDNDEISIALEDQNIVAKFPEDLILPDDPETGEQITSIDALLESEEFVYLFKDDYYWIYLAEDYSLIDKKVVVAGASDTDDDLLDLQRDDVSRQRRLKDDPIRQLFDEENLSQVDAAIIDKYGTWCVISGSSHYVRYADSENWDRRDNAFGQVDNDFENLEMIDSSYVDEQGRLFLINNDTYIRYSEPSFALGGNGTSQPKIDAGYPKSVSEDWDDENLPVQLPEFDEDGDFANVDIGPMIDGTDDNSYVFVGNSYISPQDGEAHSVADMWGHREYDFGYINSIDAAITQDGAYLLFSGDKVVKYNVSLEQLAGSVDLANPNMADIAPESGYPMPIHEHFNDLPDEFVCDVDAALEGLDGKTYLFRDDECAVIVDEEGEVTSSMIETKTQWGIIANDIADNGTVDAAFIGLDGRTYLFSGSQYVRYSGTDYTQVDDGFPRDIAEDWEGLTQVTGAFILGNKTYLFGSNGENENLYVRFSTVHIDEDDYLHVDEEDPNARTIETVLANRPDIDDIEVFPAVVNEEFWSLPQSVTNGAEDFQIDAVLNGPDGKVYLFYGENYIEHDHLNRWWSEPKVLTEQWNRVPAGLSNVTAGFTGKDGKTYLFFDSKFVRFSDTDLRKLDNGYPRPTHKYWGKVQNNIDATGRVDAALVVESRWEEQDKEGQLVDLVEDHTYLFSGDQFFRYKGTDYSQVEQGYPRHMSRLSDEPRFRGLEVDLTAGIDAAFADRRQVYLFSGEQFYAVIGDEDNYLQYNDDEFADVAAVTEEKGLTHVLRSDNNWYQLNHLDARDITQTQATPRVIEKAQDTLSDAISTVLHGIDGKSYVFAGTQFYDVSLERSFDVTSLWGRSRNPIYDQQTIDAAFVGRDGTTYVFSGQWFVQYEGDAGYVGQAVAYPPRLISSKFHGLDNVALAYVFKEQTYLFEQPDAEGKFRYLRYSKDSYERADAGFPAYGSQDYWQIPSEYLAEGFDQIDTIFAHEDNLIFISDQQFISFDLRSQTWSYPKLLDLLYSNIPFNRTDFKDLKSGFVGADEKVYFFSQQTYASYDKISGWSDIQAIRDDWGLQANIFENGVDATYVSPTGVTYLFAGSSYVRYTPEGDKSDTYRYVDAEYPKKIATYLADEDDFDFMPKEFQQHLDEIEALNDDAAYFNGIVSNGRCIHVFTRGTVFTSSIDQFAQYNINGLGSVPNNFTQGGQVNAAFVISETQQTYLFSGEQYIRYTGDDYRYIDEGYPKVISESLAQDLGLAAGVELPEDFRNGIQAAFYMSALGVVLFNDKDYIAINDGTMTDGEINDILGQMDNDFTNDDSSIDGAYIDDDGALYMFKGQQFICYSDTQALFALNPYNEPRYVDIEYPQDITEQWPHLDSSILLASNIGQEVDEPLTFGGVDTIFRFEDQIYFHTDKDFIAHEVNMSDQYEQNQVQVLAYRWGEWSDYLLSDVLALTRFKDLGEKFNNGDITLTEFVSGSTGKVREPYMDFAAIFGFEKEDVRWVKQRNAFLADAVNNLEEDFNLELVLRLYDILATCQRIRADVSSLYNKVWLPLYDSSADDRMQTAADGAYNVLVQVDCDNNYEVLVDQIKDELNVIKRDALVPYVISTDPDVTTTRGLYQKLLIDIQMSSCAKTSRIKEATAAVQLYLHRCLVNLEDVSHDVSDQEAAREQLKERWEWLQNYRVWEANRKVFLYPENYIRPELRDVDTKSAPFQSLEESLTQGDLTETKIEEAYYKFLDAFTEASELSIAGGYIYDDGDDKKLLVLGRTRTDPIRYYYRFGTFVGGASNAAVWDPWEALDIPIEATRVEPVYAFNRVFIFWTTSEEVTAAEDAGSGSVTVTGEDTQTVKSTNNSTYEAKIYYSFYNLNKQWTQPQSMQTEFSGSSNLKNSKAFSEVELFVENTTKLASYDEAYENVYIGVRYRLYGNSKYAYAAYHLAPELYSVEATPQSIENTGAALFKVLFPAEGTIENENVVMLNYSANSVDGPWFAYNHNGAGFLVKPDAISASESDTLATITSDTIIPTEANVTAAVQLGTNGDVLFFYDNGKFTTATIEDGKAEFDTSKSIADVWGIAKPTEMEMSGKVDSAFVVGNNAYLSLEDEIYEYDYADSDSATGLDNPARLVKTPYALSALDGITLPSGWTGIGASFSVNDTTYLFQKGGTGVVKHTMTSPASNVGSWFEIPAQYSTTYHNIADLFGQQIPTNVSVSTADVLAVFNNTLHVVADGIYTAYQSSGASTVSNDITVANVLKTMYGKDIEGTVEDDHYNTVAIIITEGGVWIRGVSTNGRGNTTNFIDANGVRQGSTPSNSFVGWEDKDDWVAGVTYQSGSNTYEVTFHNTEGGTEIHYAEIKSGKTKTSSKTMEEETVTGAFIDTDGDIVVIADNNTYATSNASSPSSLANVLNSGVDALSQMSSSDYFSSISNLSSIGTSESGIDAAFVGNGTIGQNNKLYLFVGEYYYRFTNMGGDTYSSTADTGYPKLILENSDALPKMSRVDAAFTSPSVDGSDDNNVSYFFYNGNEEVDSDDTPYYFHSKMTSLEGKEDSKNVWGVEVLTRLQLQETPTIDAAYLINDVMYLFTAGEYYKYTLTNGAYDKYIDEDEPHEAPDDFTAAFRMNGFTYLFKDADYYRLADGSEPSTLTTSNTITGNWGNLPADIRSSGLNAAFTHSVTDAKDVETQVLYLIQGDQFISYVLTNDKVAHPYEIQNVDYEVIRLTSSTAEQLNQKLFASGIDGLLQMATQEINESPTISFDASSPDNIQMNRARFAEGSGPTNSHLDFNSANGLYYWEVFFHAPFLIAQSLNADQKFEEAKKWYEYIYDPTRVADYWKFLPFLAADPDALVLTLSDDIENIAAVTPEKISVTETVDGEEVTTEQDNPAVDKIAIARTRQAALALALADYQQVFLGEVDKDVFETDKDDAEKLANIENWDVYKNMNTAITNLDVSSATASADNALMATWKSEMQEAMEIIARLDYRVDLMRNYTAQLSLYLDDPFDPHAIAALRPIAYRKAIVMRYVDNLLDWGDMLFRQYTRESINEARMLYVFAYDLLGEKPENMGQVILSNTKSYSEFDNYSSSTEQDYNFLIDFENDNSTNADVYEQDLSFAAVQFDSITNPYFYLKENELFTEYWNRVEDRLDKIRNCLNIDGVAVPLPLFQPPIDPMALVNAAASGGAGAAAAAAAGMGQVPDYRFSSLMGWSKDLTGKLKSFSDNLLATLEKKDSEELSNMQNQFESAILELTTELKEETILEAHNTLENLKETKKSAQEQYNHYNDLINTGYLPEEITQLAMMGTAAILHGGSALGKYISGLSYIVPQFTAGPFSFGVTTGGENIGAMLQQFGEAIQSGAEALSMGGEIAGIAAQFKRSAQDWELQRTMATNEMKQLDLQIKAQENRLKQTKAELIIHQKEIDNQQSINDFMKNKFSNQQLYSWMSGKISGLFFQTYKLAHDYAKQAEQAFIFEKGMSAGEVNYVNGAYWNSQKKGLMAGETLELDLDKMEKAYRDSDSRGLEITKNISLLELDPLALMELKNTGRCSFRLSEAMFDYDFPGHYNRQIKTISLAFDVGEGNFVNATLTQLSSMQVLEPDIKAVKHLLDPSNEATKNVRANWRSNQQVALSHVDQYTENNGMFELNFSDERYLPFEGTGAVSNWRLELSSNKDTYNPADLLDVTIKLRYTAAQGGQRFATEVKGALKPYNATSFFDLAYNFPDAWAALINGDTDSVDIVFTPDMFPMMSSSKMVGLFMHYEYEGDSGATLTLNDDLSVPNNTYLQPSTLNVGKNGTSWRFTLKGDRTTLKNAEMVLVYKAQV